MCVCVCVRRPLKHGDKRGSAGLLLPSARLPLESQSQKEGGYDPKLFHSLRYHALPYADPSSPALIAANQQPAGLPPLSRRSWNGPTHTTGLARPMGKPLSTSPPLPLCPNRPLTDGRWPWLLDLHVFFPQSPSQQHPISPRPTRSREPDGSDNVGFSRRAVGLEGPDLDPLHSRMRYKKTSSCSNPVAWRRDRSTSSNRNGVFKTHTHFHIWQPRTFYHSDPTWCPQRLRLLGRPRARALFPHMALWITPVISVV